ncbi:hypothetical protein PR002_g17848 [Phytophthora rubi]|uniref:Integrase catalytic domain-containing protein n=1 Tax=Phytophthora rubi TaxID=129364 RepID=A0A6A3K259_9STRA|nr:hypothetical protein PR002_g17848 [Phytophthora rubi]
MCYVGVGTYDGYQHFQLIQDEATRWVWGFLMKAKEEATGVAISHVMWLLAQGHRIEVFASDQGKELVNKRMKTFLRANGVEFLWTNAYSPEENGLVEKMNGVLLARVRSLLTTAHMPESLWDEAFTFAVEVVNVSASSGLDGDTPFARRFGERPDVGIMRVWGCVVHEFTPKVLRANKLENPGKLGLFLGFAKNSEGYRILNLRTGDVRERRSVEFNEDWTVESSYVEHLLANRYRRGRFNLPAVIPLVRLPVMAAVIHNELTAPPAKRQRLTNAHGSGRSIVVVEQSPVSAGGSVTEPSSSTPARVPLADAKLSPFGEPQEEVECLEHDQLHEENGDPEEAVSVPNRRSTPLRELPDSFQAQDVNDEDGEEEVADVIASGDSVRSCLSSVGDNLSGNESDEDNDEDNGLGASFRRSTRIRHPNVRLADYEIELPASLVIQAVNAILEPTSVEAALEAPDAEKWVEALNTEFAELLRNNTWELVERPADAKVLTSKWVFVRKRNARGEVERHRARITIKGCQQKYGLNFWETYAPVVCAEGVKLVLLLALHYGLECRHIDFVTAFLNGPIDCEIYMKQPEFFDDGTGRVCRLLRSLYGLKQAPRIWYKTLDKYLRQCGFQRSKMDGGIYFRWVDESPIFLTLYVDDIVIAATTENIKLVMDELSRKFKIKDLGNVSHLLSMEIRYVPGKMLSISQRGYVAQLLERFKMAKCKAVPTPQVKGNFPLPGDPDKEPVCVNIDPDVDYQSIVGSLQYLVSCSRPDITNAVRTLGKFLTCYTKEHFVLAKRVLRYLQGTREFGLVWYKPDSPAMQLVAYADADLGNEKHDRRSITGYVLQLNGCTFAYKSRKQSIVTDDTCSAEFVADSECSNLIMWTHNLFAELKIERTKKTVLFEDNRAAIHVIEEVSSGYKVRSVDLKFHKIKDFVERGVFAIEYCPSEDNVADIFTKPLGPQQFTKLRERLNVSPVPDNQ